ncbi:hypothetical protein [Bradyrhizobium sp. AS23.2]|uniref:hypothetical protein n=1 Tax=Bradyrhizobium sp. AS23.2 TaxID=1680155 RepID=UPI0011610C94|nr:hypothetical protein [Bradyrhizobium sp. AS23.2]
MLSAHVDISAWISATSNAKPSDDGARMKGDSGSSVSSGPLLGQQDDGPTKNEEEDEQRAEPEFKAFWPKATRGIYRSALGIWNFEKFVDREDRRHHRCGSGDANAK